MGRGVYYRNDEALTSGTRFLDIVTVTKSLTDIDVYQCLETHGLKLRQRA